MSYTFHGGRHFIEIIWIIIIPSGHNSIHRGYSLEYLSYSV